MNDCFWHSALADTGAGMTEATHNCCWQSDLLLAQNYSGTRGGKHDRGHLQLPFAVRPAYSPAVFWNHWLQAPQRSLAAAASRQDASGRAPMISLVAEVARHT